MRRKRSLFWETSNWVLATQFLHFHPVRVYHYSPYEYIIILPGEVPQTLKWGNIPRLWTEDSLSPMILWFWLLNALLNFLLFLFQYKDEKVCWYWISREEKKKTTTYQIIPCNPLDRVRNNISITEYMKWIVDVSWYSYIWQYQ